MGASLVRRYLVFLVVITVLVVGGEQLFQLYFLNTTGRAEAERALASHPGLAGRLGEHRFGFAWRGHKDWWTPGGGDTLIYMPVSGLHAGGILYVRELNEAGSVELKRVGFRENGSATWTLY